MKFGFVEILNLVGSLAFFIYGMKIMSESIQRVAGSELRRVLRSMTSNRFKGVITGFLITGLIQSSSATTVLVVSFVNAGLLSLAESIGVIMGANIGTTITAWLISFVGFKIKIASYAIPIIAFAFPLLFFKNDRIKSWGEVFIGFALLFLGLEYLKDAVPDLKSNPEILIFLSHYTDLGIISTLIFVAIGTFLTIAVQSSSAAMALTLVMANNGWITFDLAAAMILGENVGTTITANLAAIVGNVHAKRAAFSHFIFNIFGVIWIVLLMHPVLVVIDHYLMIINDISPYRDAHAVPIGLSVFHTFFNVMNTLLLIWFVPRIALLVTRIIKSKGDEDEDFKLEYIGSGLMNTDELSLEEAQKETVSFGNLIRKMTRTFASILEESKPKKLLKLHNKIMKYEDLTDQFEDEITKYLGKVADGNLSTASSIRLISILNIANDLERIGDVYYQMSRDFQARTKKDSRFTKRQKKQLEEMMNLVNNAVDIMVNNLGSNYKSVTIEGAWGAEQAINGYREKLRKDHINQMDDEGYNIPMSSLYVDIFQSFERIGDHVINVTEAITGESERNLRRQKEGV